MASNRHTRRFSAIVSTAVFSLGTFLSLLLNLLLNLCPLPAAHAQAYVKSVTVTIIDPSPFVSFAPVGVFDGTLFGSGSVENSPEEGHALLRGATPDSAVDLHPPGYTSSSLLGISADAQVGYGGVNSQPYATTHALLWHGTAGNVVDLNPPRFTVVYAAGVSGNTQVGYGYGKRAGNAYHALLWHGTAPSFQDLHPKGYYTSYIFGISGDTEGGYGEIILPNGGAENHALLWHGTAASCQDLNPPGSTSSGINALSADTQVGTGPGGAMLWHGTAASAVRLAPTNIAGYTFEGSAAVGVSGNTEVGSGRGYDPHKNYFQNHALLWRGSADSALDLNAYLPPSAGFPTTSYAYGVADHGGDADVIGFNARTGHAVRWHVVFVPSPPLLSLVPASRTAGNAGFPLTVSGKSFASDSVIRWNGAAQPTTYVGPTKLTASIPASLIADAGAAQITVFTPGSGPSNARTETINPRPVLASVSPSSKPAASHAFLLTVTGTGFLASSRVKWNRQPLPTTFVLDYELTAFVSASLLHAAGTPQITVTTPQVATSDGKAFAITP